jgi:hypothetical protein
MPNAIKYNVSAETLALKKGNFWIGTGDVGKGPTSSTGYYNGITPPSGGYTIYLNKATGGPSIYTVTTEAQLTGLTNTISVSTNLIKNNNGGNFANGTIAPFTGAYGTLPTIVDITNDKPYNGSTSTKAAKFVAGGGMNIYTDPTPFTMTVGVTYTFSFWYRQTNANQFNIGFNNQGGSGDVNGNFQAYSDYGNFAPPTQTWQRCSWTFTNVVNKVYFFIYSANSVAGSECLMTEFTLTEGSMPGGPGLTTSGNCLNWFTTQTDKIIFNRDYESIVTSGLTLNLDAGFSPSFATIPLNANNSTVTPWYDLSGNGNDGKLLNGPTYSSVNGGSIVFDGVDDKVSFPAITLGSNFTITQTLVASAANNNIGYMPIGGGSVSDGITFTGYIWFVTNNDATSPFGATVRIIFNQDNERGGFDFNLPTLISRYTLFQYTLVKNGSTAYFYINGSLITSQSVESARNFTVRNLGWSYSSYYMNRNLYSTQIYNRSLSSTEVLQNFNVQKGRFGL